MWLGQRTLAGFLTGADVIGWEARLSLGYDDDGTGGRRRGAMFVGHVGAHVLDLGAAFAVCHD